MTVYRTQSTDIKDQVYFWAEKMGCPSDQLPEVWKHFIGRSLALDEKSAVIQVAQIMSGIGITVDIDTFKDIILSI